MRGTGEDRDRSGDERAGREGSFREYCSARERFFARLRADSELRRLEAAWRLPARDPWPQRRAG